MPTYEYRCKECGEHLEVVQSFTDPALTECPACAGPLRKVFSSIGVTFKGSGFYKTDSRSSAKSSSKSGDKASEGSSSTSEASPNGSSDSSGSSGSSDSSKKSDSSSPKKSDSSPAKSA